MLSRIPTKSKIKKGLDPAKKKVIFVLGVIFVAIVFYGLYNLNKIAPTSDENYSIDVRTGDSPVEKETKFMVKTDGTPLNFRKDHTLKSEVIDQIPDKTALTALNEIEGWYKTKYNNEEGWLSKEYTVLKEVEKEKEKKDEFKDWLLFSGSGYEFKYPKSWSAKNYTENDEAMIKIALSNRDLPVSLDPGEIIPIELKVYLDNKPSGSFRDSESTKKEKIKDGSLEWTRYTFTSEETSTKVNVVELENKDKDMFFSFYDNGGYWEVLEKILQTFEYNDG